MGTVGYKRVFQGGGRLVYFKIIVSSTVTYLINLTLGKFSVPYVHVFHKIDKLDDSVAFQLSSPFPSLTSPFTIIQLPSPISHFTTGWKKQLQTLTLSWTPNL